MDLDRPLIDTLALATAMAVPARRIERAGDRAPAIGAGIAGGTANLVQITIGRS
jgi:benzoylformate decarboxylase